MTKTFKPGDKVYYPEYSYTIHELESTNHLLYPVALHIGLHSFSFTKNGYYTPDQCLPNIFHATEENYKKLTEFYGVDFEEPLKTKPAKEIIQAMLDDGWSSVPAYYIDKGHRTMGYAFKTYISTDAKPFDPKTGKVIVDYIDGQIVTE